jgi:hypothetical protein
MNETRGVGRRNNAPAVDDQSGRRAWLKAIGTQLQCLQMSLAVTLLMVIGVRDGVPAMKSDHGLARAGHSGS